MRNATITFCTFALLLALVTDTLAQTNSVKSRFPGTWTLTSWIVTDASGLVRHPFGLEAKGCLHYSDSGGMGVYVKDPNAKMPDATNVNPYVVLARRAAMVFTYHGTYTVDELSITVTHHVGGALNPAYLGDTQVWQFEFVGDDSLLLTTNLDNERTAAVELDETNVLKWERTHACSPGFPF